jgi:hypothetical protein
VNESVHLCLDGRTCGLVTLYLNRANAKAPIPVEFQGALFGCSNCGHVWAGEREVTAEVQSLYEAPIWLPAGHPDNVDPLRLYSRIYD